MRAASLGSCFVLLVVLAGCDRGGDHASTIADDRAETLLVERIWLDHEPESWMDRFRLVGFGRDHFGVFQDRTVWKGTFEAFSFEAKRGQLELRLPASGQVVKTGFRIERARRGDADLKLVIASPPQGPTVYWGYRFEGDAERWLTARFGQR